MSFCDSVMVESFAEVFGSSDIVGSDLDVFMVDEIRVLLLSL